MSELTLANANAIIKAAFAKAEAAKGGGQAVANLGKVAQTRIVKQSAQLGVDILGADAILAGRDAVEDGRFTSALVFSPASSIYGGTDEIQRNIISERVLKMPKEASVDTTKPFKDVPRNIAASS